GVGRAAAVGDEALGRAECRQRQSTAGVLPQVHASHLILEPSARGTTNAYGLAALTLSERFPDAVMIALPADHVVHGAALVAKAVRTAVAAAASSDNLVTVGLKPTFPSTGLGYIHAPGRLSRGTLRVKRFIEKPNAASARRFVREGGYFWNLAWFSWRLSTFIDELGRHAPRHLAGLRNVVAARQAGDEPAAAELYSRLRLDVIDRSASEQHCEL